jgi:hypothetical protein
MNSMPTDDLNNAHWCVIRSIMYKRSDCNARSSPGNPSLNEVFQGFEVTKAAVKTCETMGYTHQVLHDGAKRPCSANPEVGHFLRTTAFFTSGMSYYMEQAGFMPIHPGASLDVAMQHWCRAAHSAGRATVGNALSNNCLSAPGWKQLQLTPAMTALIAGIRQHCPDAQHLGGCYNQVAAAMKSTRQARMCDEMTALEKVMFDEEGDLNAFVNRPTAKETAIVQGAQNTAPGNVCYHKNIDVYLSWQAGTYARFSHGVLRTFGTKTFHVLPTEIHKYCSEWWVASPHKGAVGDTCLNDETCGVGQGEAALKCQAGRCCVGVSGLATSTNQCCRPPIRLHKGRC